MPVMFQGTTGQAASLSPGTPPRKTLMLRHSNDKEPGFSRKRQGKTWVYLDDKGKKVTNAGEIERLNRIALPPAYTDAWFCKDANGHVQATGIDARGRKQYRYHADYRARQDADKYRGCREFGEALPKLRARVEKDLRRRTLTREAVLAAIVRLLDKEHIRIGNEQYARSNKSFGATTLRTRHLKKDGSRVTMRFTGKHGIVHEVRLTDSNLKRIVKRCQDLPGQMLFQYLDDGGDPRPISSADVNGYIREATGGDFTAKDFRTWGASVIFFGELQNSQNSEKLKLKSVLEPVAEALGNTPAITRKSYIHPRLIDAVQVRPDAPLGQQKVARPRKYLSSAEVGFLAFLRKRRAKSAKAA